MLIQLISLFVSFSFAVIDEEHFRKSKELLQAKYRVVYQNYQSLTEQYAGISEDAKKTQTELDEMKSQRRSARAKDPFISVAGVFSQSQRKEAYENGVKIDELNAKIEKSEAALKVLKENEARLKKEKEAAEKEAIAESKRMDASIAALVENASLPTNVVKATESAQDAKADATAAVAKTRADLTDLERKFENQELARYMQAKMAKLLSSDLFCQAKYKCSSDNHQSAKYTDKDLVEAGIFDESPATPAVQDKDPKRVRK